MSRIVDLADAVVSAINAASWSQSITAVRKYQPIFDLGEMSAIHVTVVPRSMKYSLLSRTKLQYEGVIDIAVQKRIDPNDLAAVDDLQALVEEVAVFFLDNRLVDFPSAHYPDVLNEPLYAVEHMEELRQFTSVLTLTFPIVDV